MIKPSPGKGLGHFAKVDIESFSLSLPYGGLVIAYQEYINLTKRKAEEKATNYIMSGEPENGDTDS